MCLNNFVLDILEIKKEIKKEAEAADEAAHTFDFSYCPTPLAQLGQVSEAPTYSPTPIATVAQIKEEVLVGEKAVVETKKNKHDVISIILSAAKEETQMVNYNEEKKTKLRESSSKKSSSSGSSSSRRPSDSGRSSKNSSSSGPPDSRPKKESSRDASSSSSRHKSHKHKSHSRDRDDRKRSSRGECEDSSARSSKSKKAKLDNEQPAAAEEDDVPDSVLSFLSAMNEIDKKLEASEPKSAAADVIMAPPKKIVQSASFLSALSRPDKVHLAVAKVNNKPKVVQDQRPKTTGGSKTRISVVSGSDADLSSTVIARKKSLNPVQAMLSRVAKARVASQTKDLEDQLGALTGETPSTSNDGGGAFQKLPEGLRKGKVARKAHNVTNTASLRKPVITSDSNGKVPNNVRQRYLDTITDECLKLYPRNVAAAYKRAEDEEKVCSDKSKSRSIYLNFVVNCIKRLRDEVKETGSSLMKEAAGGRSPTKITPNLLTTHMQVLTGKPGTRGTWSIESPVKNVPSLTKKMFYQVLKRYLLTEDQMEENGYPTPTNLSKSLDEAKFAIEERTCDRCGRSFRVGEDCRQIVDEQCVFHWGRLRKNRGNRGQYTILLLLSFIIRYCTAAVRL
jgi:hypothetical protein